MIKMLKNKLKEQKGLTLIELLAVIVILGIIAAIAIPSITKVIENSRNDAKVAEAIQIIEAAKLANVDGTGTPDSTTTPTTYTWSGTSADTDAIDKYVSKVKDKEFTVTYTISSNSYKIAGHTAADTTDVDAGTNAGTLTEEQLADLAD